MSDLERVVVAMSQELAEVKRALADRGDPNLIKIATAAHLTDTSVTFIRDLYRAGKIKRYGEGRTVRVSKAELFAYLERPSEPASDAAIEARAALLVRGGR